MNLEFAKHQPPPWLRFTAMLAALLVMVLSIASVSPTVHAWLHGQHFEASGAKTPAHLVPQDGSPYVEDGCAILLFSSGVLAAYILIVLLGAFRRVVKLSFVPVAAIGRATPRYWLPPLCGPPLN